MRWNYYKLRQLSLLQSAMDCYYKLRHLFYYRVRHGLLQIATGVTKCDGFITNFDRYYKVRWLLQIATVQTWLLHYLLLFMNCACGVGKFTKSWLWTCKSSKIFSILWAGRLAQSSYSFELFKFRDFPWLFPWPFQVFHNLRFSCHFRKLSKLFLF